MSDNYSNQKFEFLINADARIILLLWHTHNAGFRTNIYHRNIFNQIKILAYGSKDTAHSEDTAKQ